MPNSTKHLQKSLSFSGKFDGFKLSPKDMAQRMQARKRICVPMYTFPGCLEPAVLRTIWIPWADWLRTFLAMHTMRCMRLAMLVPEMSRFRQWMLAPRVNPNSNTSPQRACLYSLRGPHRNCRSVFLPVVGALSTPGNQKVTAETQNIKV